MAKAHAKYNVYLGLSKVLLGGSIRYLKNQTSIRGKIRCEIEETVLIRCCNRIAADTYCKSATGICGISRYLAHAISDDSKNEHRFILVCIAIN